MNIDLDNDYEVSVLLSAISEDPEHTLYKPLCAEKKRLKANGEPTPTLALIKWLKATIENHPEDLFLNN